MKTEALSYQTRRLLRTSTPVYVVRFFTVRSYGDGIDYPFSADFSTRAPGGIAPSTWGATPGPWIAQTGPWTGSGVLPVMMIPSGNTQTVEPENGRSSVGNFLLRFVDVGGEVLRYLSLSNHTLQASMTATSPADGEAIAFSEVEERLPKRGTIEIATGGVIERVRYTGRGRGVVTGITRGVDGTVKASHTVGDPVTNGEQIRPGNRAQIYAGYSDIAFTDFLAFSKMEVVGRNVEADGVTFDVQLGDVQRSLRQQIFLAATPTAPISVSGNPIDIALAVLHSTGGRIAGQGTITISVGVTTVVGVGTSFLSFLTPGTVVALSTGEIVRVKTVTDATHFEAVQAPNIGGAGLSYWIGSTSKVIQGGLGPVVAGAGTIAVTAGNPIVTGTGTAFTTFLAVGSSVVDQTGQSYVVVSITNDTTITVSPAPVNSGTLLVYWLQAAAGGTATPPGGRWDILAAGNGLAIAPSLIDVAGIEALRDASFPAQFYAFSITDRVDGKTALESEIWKTLECYPVIKGNGTYSAKRYAGLTGTSIFSFTEANILTAGWSLGDQKIINVVAFDYDWNLASSLGNFGTQQIYTHLPSVATYGRRPPLIIASRGIRTLYGGQAIADDRAREVTRRFANPPPVLVIEAAYSSHTVEPGDQVDVTHSQIPNVRTGRRGLTSELFEVVDVSPIFETGRIRFSLLWLGAMTDPGAPTSAGAAALPPTAHLEMYGYRLDINGIMFSSGCPSTPNFQGFGLGFDSIDGRLDGVFGGDTPQTVNVNFGEADLHGVQIVAPASKLTTPGVVTSATFDGTNLQIALIDVNARVVYSRLDKDGNILQAPVVKFSPSGGHFFFAPKLAAKGSTLYWVWRDSPSSGSTNYRQLFFATTNLSGTIVTAQTLVSDHSADSDLDTLRGIGIGVDSLGNAHIVYTKQRSDLAGTPSEIWYVKVSSVGAILIPHKQIIPVQTNIGLIRIDGAVMDENDHLHVVLNSSVLSSTGVARQYFRLALDSTITVPVLTILADPTWTADSDGAMARDASTGHIYIAVPKPTNQAVLMRLARIE